MIDRYPLCDSVTWDVSMGVLMALSNAPYVNPHLSPRDNEVLDFICGTCSVAMFLVEISCNFFIFLRMQFFFEVDRIR